MLLHNALTCEISHTSSVLGRGAGGSVHLPLCAMLFLSQNSWKASLMLDGVGNVKAWASLAIIELTPAERRSRWPPTVFGALTLGLARWPTPSRVPLTRRTSRWRR